VLYSGYPTRATGPNGQRDAVAECIEGIHHWCQVVRVFVFTALLKDLHAMPAAMEVAAVLHDGRGHTALPGTLLSDSDVFAKSGAPLEWA